MAPTEIYKSNRPSPYAHPPQRLADTHQALPKAHPSPSNTLVTITADRSHRNTHSKLHSSCRTHRAKQHTGQRLDPSSTVRHMHALHSSSLSCLPPLITPISSSPLFNASNTQTHTHSLHTQQQHHRLLSQNDIIQCDLSQSQVQDIITRGTQYKSAQITNTHTLDHSIRLRLLPSSIPLVSNSVVWRSIAFVVSSLIFRGAGTAAPRGASRRLARRLASRPPR